MSWDESVAVRMPRPGPAPAQGAGRAGAAKGWRSLNLVALLGLAGSVLALLVSLPSLTEAGGVGLFIEDLFAHAWVLALLTLVAGPVRTLRFPAFAATGFAGFFGMFGVAALVGRPVMTQLEQQRELGSVVVMPLIEELLKVLPALIMVVIAMRRATRPSATDIMLLGAWAGAGFALHENALFGRGGFNFDSPPVLTLLFPVLGTRTAEDSTVIGAGHLVWTALIALGLGIGLLYRSGRWSWIAIPVTFAVAFTEHAVANAVSLESIGVPIQLAKILVLGGGMSLLLLAAGLAFIVYVEWTMTSHRRMTRLANAFGRRLPPLPPAHVPRWVWLTAWESQRRGLVLGVWQATPPKPAKPAPVGGRPAGLRQAEGRP